jgi:hypothetical protein
MLVYAIDIPELNTVDELSAARERRDQRTRDRMSKKAYKDAILQRISEAMDDDRHPLGELTDQLFDAPIRDAYDYRAFLEMRDGRRVGATVLTAICEASLEAYQDADTEGF